MATALLRRLRGALGNALVWAAGWFTAAFGLFTVLKLVGVAPEGATWEGLVRMAAMVGVMGGLAGTAFATFIGLRYRGRRLSEISWVRFGLGGAVVTGLFVPSFIIVARLIAGDPALPLEALVDDAVLGVVFGGVAAGGSLWLAQRVAPQLPDADRDQLDSPEDAARLQ